MDKSWMSKYRLSKAYINGVEAFLEFANTRMGKDCLKLCPCRQCLNLFERDTSEIRYHLYRHGIASNYTHWTCHGEGESNNRTDHSHHADYHGQPFVMDIPEDATLTKEAVQAAREQYMGDPDKFHELLQDADEPVYKNCSKYTRLSTIVFLFNLKAKSSWSDISFSRLLSFLEDLLPDDNLIPKSMDEVKKILSVYGMKYERIHACPNDCILYRGEYEHESVCPTCGASRYKENKSKTKASRGVPAKVLWYFPPIPRFKRMFQSAKTAKDLIWHASEREVDDKLRHPADSTVWKFVDMNWPMFGKKSRNLRLALSADGVNPHGSLNSKYSCRPVLLVIYNLPPWLCMKRKFMLLTLLISGPRQPGNDIDVYLRPLIDDLKLLWEKGVKIFDAHLQETFTLRAVLLWTINDYPAYGNLSGCTIRGYFACVICGEDTVSERLKHCNKNVFRSHRRYLERHHPYRRQRKAFNGQQEFRVAPKPLTGEEILSKISGIVNSWGKKEKQKKPQTSVRLRGRHARKKEILDNPVAATHPQEENCSHNTGPMRCWKKISVFYILPYWKDLPVRHNLDVMHIEKNVCESIIGTLLNIPGKTKDGINSRLDLQELGVRTELTPKIRDGRPFLPAACYTMSKKEKTRVCQILHDLKVPKGYSSNLRAVVSMQDLKLTGLKSHDCHVLMQQLLPVAIRSVLPKHVRYAIIRLCYFFNAICAKVVDVPKLLDLQKEIAVTLCMLETIFPPSFFDIMVHLTIHLVREVQLCGPVFLRWMYAFERNMTVLKGYVRNRNRPEGCIAENYIAEEAVEFLSEFFPGLDAVGVPSNRAIMHEDMVLYGDPPLGGKLIVVDVQILEQAHHSVLQNTDEVQPYIGLHMDYLKENFRRQSKRPSWLQQEHNRTFCDWLKEKVLEERQDPSNDISESLRWIAKGPFAQVRKYETYDINGYHFATRSYDAKRVNQNSGVSLVATTMQVSSAKDKNPAFSEMCFYGVIVEIWLLDYCEFRIPLLKCEWVDNKNGVKIDDLGFTLVDRGKIGYKSDPFILASQAKQVFYVNDESDPQWSVVLATPQRCYLDGDKDNDQYDGNVGENARAELLQNIELFESLDDTLSPYLREDCEGTWVDN